MHFLEKNSQEFNSIQDGVEGRAKRPRPTSFSLLTSTNVETSASWSEARRKDHVKRFCQYTPSLNNAFSKPSNTGKKPRQYQRIRSGYSEPEILIERDEINTATDGDGGNQPNNPSAEGIRFSDSRTDPPKEFELHLKLKLPKAISKCQGKGGKTIFATDSLIVHFFGTAT